MNKLCLTISLAIFSILILGEYDKMLRYIKVNESIPKKLIVNIQHIKHGDTVSGIQLKKCMYEDIIYPCL